MKLKKKMGKRFLASVLSAALLTSTTAVSLNRTPTVKAADNDYYQALALSLYFFDANACGSDVSEGPLTWRGDCHTYDGKAAISEAVNFDSSVKSIVDPDGDGYVDVDGGYHDAGDHIKFNLTMGFGATSLALSEYLNPGVYEKAGCKDHLIAILKRNADYLMKTTFLDASGNVATICHVVADGGADHAIWTAPEEQTYARPTYWLTASSNNSAVCCEMAASLAGTAYVVKDSDPAYAAECIKYAKALIAFGTQHVGNEGCGLSSFYPNDAQYQDELAMAEAWLYVLGEGSKPSYTPSNGNYGNNQYDGYLYCWDKVWQGYAALMYKATGDSAFSSELAYELQKNNGLNVGTYNGDGWGAARYNCAKQMVAYALANGDANSSYATGAKWQMDYILGDNPTGYSFLIGYGSKWPTHYHHRAANPGDGNQTSADNPESKYTLYGALVGGIDASGNYQDHADSYQYTEGALDYNGCFALACAALADLYGGSDKGAASIVSTASEIKYPYSFGSGTVTPQPSTEPSSDEPTTESTPSEQPTTESTSVEQPTTESTPTPTNPSTPTEKNTTYTELLDESDNTYWQFDTTGAIKLTVTMKTNSNDTETNGCWNPPGGWAPEDWEAPANGGTFTVVYDIPSGQNYVDLHVWWPNSCTVVSAVLTFAEEQTQPTTQPTTTPTENTSSSGGDDNINYGDVDESGNVDLLDVILLNKNLMVGTNISEQGKKNADVDRNNTINAVDSLNILKYCVKLTDLPVA